MEYVFSPLKLKLEEIHLLGAQMDSFSLRKKEVILDLGGERKKLVFGSILQSGSSKSTVIV